MPGLEISIITAKFKTKAEEPQISRFFSKLLGLIRIGEAGAAAPRRCHGHHEWLDQKSSARANGIQGEQP